MSSTCCEGQLLGEIGRGLVDVDGLQDATLHEESGFALQKKT